MLSCRKWLLVALTVVQSIWVMSALAENPADKLCNSCHQLGDKSPVHAMMASVHGKAEPGTPMSEQGCAQCHGASNAHTQAPTKVKPDISFGPTWSDSVTAQNKICLNCHEKNTAKECNKASFAPGI